jgi:putative hydrolase of the HAD superfamily
MESVKAVFFDAAGTLFRVHGSVGHIYAEVARHFGILADPVALERSFVAAFRANSAKGFPVERAENLRIAERTWWMGVVRQAFGAGMPEAVLPAYFDHVFELFRSAAVWELYPDAQPTLEDLRSRGYRLGVISNFDSRLHDLLVNLGIRSYFEHVILSWQVGSAKPDVGIFRRALELMDVKGKQALHVGDSPEEDVAGALSSGLHAVLLDRRGAWTTGPDHQNVRSLNELCMLLQ